MSDWGEPKRWHESDLPADVRGVLESASADDPPPARLAGMEQRLAGVLGWPPHGGDAPADPSGGGASGGTSGVAPGATTTSVGLAAGAGAALLAVAVGVAVWAANDGEDGGADRSQAPGARVETEQTTAVAPDVQQLPPDESPIEPLSESPVLRSDTPPADRPVRVPVPRSTPSEAETAAEPSAPESTLAEELRLVDGSRNALDVDPTRALALAAEHRARFPAGALAPERELLAIEALLLLGRSGEATARAADFERRHHVSAHARRLHRLLADHGIHPDSIDNQRAPTPIRE